jgi:tRNA A-37 threonylcarbamoyl transferase component Bud32
MSDRPLRLSASDLVAAGRDLPGEFHCRLLVTDASADAVRLHRREPAPTEVTIHCLRVLRLLPERRLVALADMAGRLLVLKLFLGAGAGRYREREARGCALLAAAGVATPALLGRVSATDGIAEGLLFEYLEDARPLGDDDPADLLGAVAELARLHHAGAAHRDPHLENFLRRRADGRVFLIDGDGVRPALRALGRRASLENLALLCAQRALLAGDDLERVHAAYAAVRGWRRSPERDAAGVQALARATGRKRRARVRRYLHKAQRDCTEFACERSWRRYLICVRASRDAALDALLADPDAAIDRGDIVKSGNSATVARVRLGERTCIVKRYNQKSWWHALRRALKPAARFRRAWLNGQRLHLLGIPTARPLALLERRFGPLRGVAYLVMEDLGGVDLAGAAAAQSISNEVLEQVVRLFRALHAAGLRHGDTKASNFIIGDQDVAVVDLDAMRQVVPLLIRDTGEGGSFQHEDVVRFLANFDAVPVVRERFADAFEAAGLAPAAVGSRGVAGPTRRL